MNLRLSLPLLDDPLTGKQYLVYHDHFLDFTVASGLLRVRYEQDTGLSADDDLTACNISRWYCMWPEILRAVLDRMVTVPPDRVDIVERLQSIERASKDGEALFMQQICDYYAASYFYDYGGISSLYPDTTFYALVYALAERLDIDTFIGVDVDYEVRAAIFSRLAKMLSCSVEDLYLTWVYGYKR